MIKVFNSLQEFNNYTNGGLVAGDLYYVLSDGSVHFRTNNIDGKDTVYKMNPEPVLIEGEFTENGTYEPEEADGYSSVVVNVSGGSEPEYTALNLNTFHKQGYNFDTLISATVGQTIEVYNPNHFNISVGPASQAISPSTGEPDGYYISQNGISSYDSYNDNYLEHLYVQNAPDTSMSSYSQYGFAITYYSAAGTPTDGVIYYRIIDDNASQEDSEA